MKTAGTLEFLNDQVPSGEALSDVLAKNKSEVMVPGGNENKGTSRLVKI
jgi:hypothetical protein